MGTRREWLCAASAWLACRPAWAARKRFWESEDPSRWSEEEKQIVLGQSPWAREGFARMDDKKPPTVGYGNNGRQGIEPPDLRPGTPVGGAPSVPIGEPIPRAPEAPGPPVQFRVLARWETAKPVRLAGGPEVPELTGQYYVIRMLGLPLMPPPKAKPGEAAPPDPNQDLLHEIQQGTRLLCAGREPIPCAHLFTGSGNRSREVLVFFSRAGEPITIADKVVTLDSRFGIFRLSIQFPLKEMLYRGELAL